jgi:hypothetical protein
VWGKLKLQVSQQSRTRRGIDNSCPGPRWMSPAQVNRATTGRRVMRVELPQQLVDEVKLEALDSRLQRCGAGEGGLPRPCTPGR